MDVKVAKSAGFCFGVKRAVEQVYKQIEENHGAQKIYTYGPIIHNEAVVNDLADKGVEVLEDEAALAKLQSGVVIIRSHGVEKRIYDMIERQGLTLVDATCPFVRKIHRIVQEQREQGRHIIIIGNPGHPEVQGIMGWAGTDLTVLHTEEEAEKFTLPEGKKGCIVSQTTFNYNKFKYLVEIISKKGYDISVLDTICNATHERQAEAKKIAKEVDAMIVIGGKHSSNTQKLYEICARECDNTYYIQTLEDLDINSVTGMQCVGITAGASTPNNIIEEVQAYVRTEF